MQFSMPLCTTGAISRGNLAAPFEVKIDRTEARVWIATKEISLKALTQIQRSVILKACEQLVDASVETEKKTINSCAALPLITKVTKQSFENQPNSYTVELDFDDINSPLKLFVNLRKSDENAYAGSGEFKISKIMKAIDLHTGKVTDEKFVRGVVKKPKNGITCELLVFARIKQSTGQGLAHVIQGNAFSFKKQNGTPGTACISPYYPHSFNLLELAAKKRAMPAIAAGIEHLHASGIVHCDINGKNILITADGAPVIIDIEGALVFDSKTGALDTEFKEKRADKRVYFMRQFAPFEVRKCIGSTFDALEFDRAKKWDMFAFGLLVNDVYNLGIQVDGSNETQEMEAQVSSSIHEYVKSISESDNGLDTQAKDYQVYKAPLAIQEHDKQLVAVVLKCLQGQAVTWQEIKNAL